MKDIFEIKDDGDVVLYLNESEKDQFIPITELQKIGDDFFETLKTKVKEAND